MRFFILALSVAFTATGYSEHRPSVGHSIREKIEEIKGLISQNSGYSASCILDTTGLEGCVTGLQKLQFALKAPETKTKDFSHIILSNYYKATTSADGHVVVDANGTIREIQSYLGKQRNRDTEAVIEEKQLQAAFAELKNKFTLRTGYETFCNESELKLAGCLKALQAVVEATNDQNTLHREFRSLYLTTEFKTTDLHERVWINGRAGVTSIRSHLLKQRLASDPEVEYERSLRQEIASLSEEISKSSGHAVICMFDEMGLENGLEGLQNLSIALSDLPQATSKRFTLFISNRTEGPTINGYVILDYRLSIQEMHRYLRWLR